jgi:hypothetical protein
VNAFYDVFNGDADGILALHQLRLAEPRPSILVTGVKRDIALLERVHAGEGEAVTALDISLKRNSTAVARLLAAGARVDYFDHHEPGVIPAHASFSNHIDTAPDICTSLIVSRELDDRFLIWAAVAAFGDNLADVARRKSELLGLGENAIESLKELGECVNYNAYGESIADLYFPPDALFRRIHNFTDPFAFMREDAAFEQLREGRASDIQYARALGPAESRDTGAIYILPDAPWARRISGIFANELARTAPSRAHAILTQMPDGFVVSVRAPVATRIGADTLCTRFATGGGRSAAAGINFLPEAEFEAFARAFHQAF